MEGLLKIMLFMKIRLMKQLRRFAIIFKKFKRIRMKI